MRWCLLFLIGWGAVARGLAAGPEAWPWRGAVAGAVKIAALENLDLRWRAELTETGLRLAARRPGVELEISVTAANAGEWTWELTRGEVDLAEAWPAVRALAGEAGAGWSASGRLTLAGRGRWSGAEGPTGEVRVELREGWAKSDELDLELSGVELDLVARDFTGGVLAPGQSLRVARVSKAGAEVKNVAVRFGLTAKRELEVAGGEADFLGGRVKLGAFTTALDKPVVRAVAAVEALKLGELALLMPWLLAEGRGDLRGRVALDWDEAKGLRVRDGGLDIVAADGAVLRLAASPGLLTGDMPRFFGLLPASWRWAKWVGFRNPAYEPLQDIELGKTGLQIEAFRVVFWPDEVGAGRSMAIKVVGRPTAGELVEEVVIDLNVNGPLNEVMGFGLNQDLGGIGFKLQ
jgi:hypothetical protein